jgi:hypothetical protein
VIHGVGAHERKRGSEMIFLVFAAMTVFAVMAFAVLYAD